MVISPLAKKLRLGKAGRALILNAPKGFVEILGDVEEVTTIDTAPSGEYGFAHLFARNWEELGGYLDVVLGAVEPDAIFWVSYPKSGSGVETDLNRDKLRKGLAKRGIRPVAQVSIDEVWSAMRFRPIAKAGH